MFYVSSSHPFNITRYESSKNVFESKSEAIQFRFTKMFERMDNHNIQDIYTIYNRGKLQKVYTREFLEMSFQDRIEKYPEVYI